MTENRGKPGEMGEKSDKIEGEIRENNRGK